MSYTLPQGTLTNVSMFGEAPSTAWRATMVYRATNAGAHAASGQSAYYIGNTAVGSGTNGPTNADYGQSISMVKASFDTTSVVGEIDGLQIAVRQGGPGSDCAGILINAAHYGTGFTAAVEAQSTIITAGSPVQGVQTAVGVVDNVLNKHYGFTAVKNYGVDSGDGYYVGDGAAGAAFLNAYRVYYGGADVYTVSAKTGAVLSKSSILSASPSAGIGYATGAGGTVTQATSKSTGVTINTVCGNIVTHNASLAAGGVVSFTVTNSALGATDFVDCKRVSGGTAMSYFVDTDSMAAGSFVVYLQNITAGALAEAITLRFKITKVVTA